MSKCIGCGAKLQNTDENKNGYVLDINHKCCVRCFKIKNYNNHDIKGSILNNIELLSKINKKNCFTFFLCDFLSLSKKNIDLYLAIENKKVFVITKMDIIPKNIELNKLKDTIKKVYGLDNVIFFSKESGYGKNNILSLIESNDKVIFAGPSNSGKSSLINYLFDKAITVSNHKNTTLDFISIDYEGYIILDAPGFNDDNIVDKIDFKKDIKPKTLQLKTGFVLEIYNYQLYFEKDANLTLFLPNNIEFKTYKKKDNFTNELEIIGNSDVIINNIGFIYLKDNKMYINDLTNIEVRKSIIGVK